MSFGTFYTVLAAFEGITVWGGMKTIPVRTVLDHIDGTIQKLASQSNVAIGGIGWRCVEHYVCVGLARCLKVVPWIPVLFFVASPLVVLGCSCFAGIDVETVFANRKPLFVRIAFWICIGQLLLFLVPKLWFSRYKGGGVLSDAEPRDDALSSL